MIGRSIRLLRVRAGKTQYEMAKHVGCGSATWSKYENDLLDVPLHIIEELKKYFSWDGSEVFRTEEEINHSIEIAGIVDGIVSKA